MWIGWSFLLKNKNSFLIVFIKFSGWLEIFFGVMFFFMDPLMSLLEIPNFVFWTLFSGVTLFYMGILLLYSARDLEKYKIIPIVSSFFRFTMAVIVVITIITNNQPILSIVLIFAALYDFSSALFTLILLKNCGYFKKIEN